MKQPLLKDWLQEEPFNLVLSCGFFAFFTHSGVLCALEDSGIKPKKISGCSAGAIVGASWASGISAYEIRENFFELEMGHFWDPKLGLGLLKGEKFDECLRKIMKDRFDQLEIPMQAVAFDPLKMKAVTIDEGDLPTAVRASAGVPGMFHPVRHNNRLYFDGALNDRIGLTGVPEDERVFAHFINFDFYNLDFELDPIRQRCQSNNKMILFKDMPGVNILQLEKGKVTWKIAYEKTMELLNQPVFDDHVKEIYQGVKEFKTYSKPRRIPAETLVG